MTRNEQIQKREELVAEQRKINLAVKILNSESIPMNDGVKYALIQYQERLKKIDYELRALAEARVEEYDGTTEPGAWTIEWDFEGEKAYPTNHKLLFSNNCTQDEVLKWNDMNDAKSFAAWYAGKYAWRIVPVDKLPRN